MKRERWILLHVWLFGAIWGVAEAVAGGFLHWIHFPMKGPVMAGIGFFLMAAALGATGRAWVPLAMGVVAAAIKLIDLVVMPPPDALWVLRPTAAILVESLLFSALAACVGSGYRNRIGLRVAGGLLAGSLTFVLLGLTGFGQRNMTVPEFLLVNGAVAAFVTALLIPLGHELGRRSSRLVLVAWDSRPALVGAGAVLATLLGPVLSLVLTLR